MNYLRVCVFDFVSVQCPSVVPVSALLQVIAGLFARVLSQAALSAVELLHSHVLFVQMKVCMSLVMV